MTIWKHLDMPTQKGCLTLRKGWLRTSFFLHTLFMKVVNVPFFLKPQTMSASISHSLHLQWPLAPFLVFLLIFLSSYTSADSSNAIGCDNERQEMPSGGESDSFWAHSSKHNMSLYRGQLRPQHVKNLIFLFFSTEDYSIESQCQKLSGLVTG